jgi:hypothetical protein
MTIPLMVVAKYVMGVVLRGGGRKPCASTKCAILLYDENFIMYRMTTNENLMVVAKYVMGVVLKRG